MLPGALSGIRILDADEGIAAGYCTRLLAGLGADVVKVEHPGTGDVLRRKGPFPGDRPHIEASGLHLHLNAGKRSVTLDVACASGAALLHRMAERADVLIAPAGPQASAVRRDADQRVSETARPLINVQIEATAEVVAMARGGYLSLNGDPDREPVKVWGEQAHYQAGIHAALGIVAALRARDVSAGAAAEGERVQVDVAEAAAFLTAGALQRWHLMKRPQTRSGARPAGFAPNRLYPSTVRPCADGHVHVHCHNRHDDLISLLMDDEELRAPDLLAEPLGHADEIDARMDRWLATRTRADAVAAAQELRVPMTEAFSPADVLADTGGHHAARRSFVEAGHPFAGPVKLPGAPIRMPGAPWRMQRAPLLGEHNINVYCDELGLSPRELSWLRAAGVV